MLASPSIKRNLIERPFWLESRLLGPPQVCRAGNRRRRTKHEKDEGSNMDRGWNEFAEVCRRAFDSCTFKSALAKECGDNDDIAWATFYHAGEQSMQWLRHNVPALDGHVPSVLIATGQADRVRVCLMRMP